jgi:quinoprotein glucose dehydrogenase
MQTSEKNFQKAVPIKVAAFIFLLAGLFLAIGGVWLAAVGGSVYYLVLSIALALTGVLLLRRSFAALWLYAVIVFGTLGWAVWEVGFDWWPLAARLGVLFFLGLLLLTPWITRHLNKSVPAISQTEHSKSSSRICKATVGLAIVLAVTLLVVFTSGFSDQHAVNGELPGADAGPATGDSVPPGEWHAYGRTAAGQRYSPLTQFNAENIGKLQVAWTARTGDVRGQKGDPEETTYEVTPLKIGDRLFLCNPHQSVLALDATTGKEIWRYQPNIQGQLALQHLTCRGLSYQPPSDRSFAKTAIGTAGETQSVHCASKLFMPTADGRLIALNPETGKICSEFGNGNGEIDLWANMPNKRLGAYYSTSPVVVTHNLVIVGGTVLDNASTKEQSGVIRAFDIQTGALVWNWDSGNPENTAPLKFGETYVPNSPNSWSISSVDEQLGMVYIPMGNQPPDQWGGNRGPHTERYSSSVVALDLGSGKVRWVFQTVHHDLWDYDVPSQPSLIDLKINGNSVPALVQPTKQGELFVLDRRTGTPILPVKEVPAPQGAAAGDHTAATQPQSQLSYSPPPLKEKDMWGVTMFDQLACRIAFRKLRYDGRFTPPSEQGSLIYPGNFGVFNWGSIAVDPVRQVAFTTPAYLAFVSTLVPRHDDTSLMVQKGGEQPPGSLPALNENFGAPFAAKLLPFLSPVGIPCQAPPWGYVAGADLRTGKIVWMHRNGTVRDLSPVPVPIKMGVPSLGGPIMTAGGVAFMSGTLDNYVRGYDVTTGKQLWQSRLPAGGQATPMTYLGKDQKQYLLVVAGGHGSTGTKPGDYLIAYSLPTK